MTTKLTIGMPVFNDVNFIEESIKSILNQSFSDFKLIISDDGATDGSELICQEYAKQDTRITYIRQEKNLGISKNMMYLLNQCETEFFMWAGDDDLYDEKFIEECLNLLKSDPNSISAFCKYDLINENNEHISTRDCSSYRNTNKVKRIKSLIHSEDDGFGYGIFRYEKIKNVHFPIWWWPNRSTPYNNIYPTLCYYLAKGNYIQFNESSLFFKRVKTNKNVHHKIVGKGSGIKEIVSFSIRRINLVWFSFKQIRKSSNWIISLKILPLMIRKWIFKSIFNLLKLSLTNRFS